ncbi:P-loop containing nucleoside triphosphate hydrolase protein [Rhexocercosporidium sp. MPI-PUGE-AT-0058]|nr:P-loop containing nucleoside triphosphate hydrolase protein [Rhexocercosporidium sp. MPI-PUGE-AT-0058]
MADSSKPSDANMILVMGVTGSGKSYLINQLAGRKVAMESAELDSCTAICQAIPVEIGRTKVLLIDTPGFDDSKRTDVDILTEISKLLAAQYKLGVSLKGIIYLHRITDNRYQGSSVRTLDVFREICGEKALRNVILASTRWDKVQEHEGAARETQLREKFWSYMLDHGSKMTRYYGDRDSAHAMISQLLGSGNVVLDIQRQLVDEGKSLDETTAGALVNGNISDAIKRSNAEIELLQRQLRESSNAMRQKLEDDRKREETFIRQARHDQVSLQAYVGQEVQDEMSVEMGRRKKKSKSLGIIMPLLPAALSILGMFVGVPSSVTGLFSSWILGEEGDGGIFNELSEIFA